MHLETVYRPTLHPAHWISCSNHHGTVACCYTRTSGLHTVITNERECGHHTAGSY